MKLLVFVALCLVSGAQAQGTISVRWVTSAMGNAADIGGIRGGVVNGIPAFVCRGWLDNQLIAGKLIADTNVCVIPYRGIAHNVRDYEFAMGSHGWVIASDTGTTSPRAVIVGYNNNRQPTYACRATHGNSVVPGKVDARACWIAFNGREIRYASYMIFLHIG